MTDRLIILAAGMSSRMKKQTSTDISLSEEEKKQANQRTKGLISIDTNGRPLLDYILFNASKAGIQHVYIVTNKDNQLFKNFYGIKQKNNEYKKGCFISYAIQNIPENRTKPLGTADAICQTLEQYPELKMNSFILCNSDNLYSEKAFKLLINSTETPHSLISYDRDALLFPKDRIARFALLKFNKGYLSNIIEKPSANLLKEFKDDDGKLRVSMNIFKFDGSVFFKYVKECPLHPDRNEKEIPTALLNMIHEYPDSVIGIPLSEHVPDITSKDDIPIIKDYIKNINLTNW